MASAHVFECQIRDTEQHYSTDDPAGDDQYTVVEDTLHSPRENDLRDADAITIYVDDTHDNTFTIGVETTAADDDDWTGVVQAASADGQDNARHSVAGPAGKLRCRFDAAGTAPTSGRCRVVVYAWP